MYVTKVMQFDDFFSIQFPTVTICADGDHDRWAVIRMLLNQLAFACEFDDADKPSDVEYLDWTELQNPEM